jgi:hypothetical protein
MCLYGEREGDEEGRLSYYQEFTYIIMELEKSRSASSKQEPRQANGVNSEPTLRT